MGRVTGTAAATLAIVALAAAVPAVAAAVPGAAPPATAGLAAAMAGVAAVVPGGAAPPTTAEERNYTVLGYSELYPLDIATFHIVPAQRTWSVTIRFDVFELVLFQGPYTTIGNVSTFIDTEDAPAFPSCNFTLATGPSASHYAGVGSCKTSSSAFPLDGLVVLTEK
jgi:hypothetical protein